MYKNMAETHQKPTHQHKHPTPTTTASSSFLRPYPAPPAPCRLPPAAVTAQCNDCTLLSLHNAITIHPTRPPPYPGVNHQTLASLSFSATTAPTCWPTTFHPLPPPTTTAPRSPFYPGVNQKMHPLLIPQPALGTPSALDALPASNPPYLSPDPPAHSHSPAPHYPRPFLSLTPG